MNLQWRKSTRSEDHGNCVEVAAVLHAVAIRDSRTPDAGRLTLTPDAFADFLARAKQDSRPCQAGLCAALT